MRLIDADKFAERLNASPAFINMGQDGYFMRDIVLNLLSKQPTVDIKTEVAKEIFAEIYDIGDISIDKYDSLYLTLSFDKYIELKNKYTKEGVGE